MANGYVDPEIQDFVNPDQPCPVCGVGRGVSAGYRGRMEYFKCNKCGYNFSNAVRNAYLSGYLKAFQKINNVKKAQVQPDNPTEKLKKIRENLQRVSEAAGNMQLNEKNYENIIKIMFNWEAYVDHIISGVIPAQKNDIITARYLQSDLKKFKVRIDRLRFPETSLVPVQTRKTKVNFRKRILARIKK